MFINTVGKNKSQCIMFFFRVSGFCACLTLSVKSSPQKERTSRTAARRKQPSWVLRRSWSRGLRLRVARPFLSSCSSMIENTQERSSALEVKSQWQ